jgi:hypothetical protein
LKKKGKWESEGHWDPRKMRVDLNAAPNFSRLLFFQRRLLIGGLYDILVI